MKVVPMGEYVVIRFHKIDMPLEKISKGGLVLLGEDDPPGTPAKEMHYATILSIGPDVPKESIQFEEDDKVFFNQYDMKMIQGDEESERYGLCKYTSIMATYVSEPKPPNKILKMN